MILNVSWENRSSEPYYPYDFQDKQIYKDNFNNIISDFDQIDNCNININEILKIIPAIVQILDKYSYLSLARGDFLCFDRISLLILNPLRTITTKLCVLLGYLVSIHIGHCIMTIVKLNKTIYYHS